MPINKHTVSPSQTPLLNIDVLYYKNHSDVTRANFIAENSRLYAPASSDSIKCSVLYCTVNTYTEKDLSSELLCCETPHSTLRTVQK